MSNSNSHLTQDLFDLCIAKISECFILFSKISNCSISDINISQFPDDIDHRSEIILYGVNITFRIQFFYNSLNFTNNLESLYEKVTKERVIDFFGETANLTAGKIKEVLFDQGIVCALSLPMNISTSKLKVIEGTEVLSKFKYCEMKLENERLFASKISFEIHDEIKFKDFNKNYKRTNVDDGEVEFF